MTKNVTDKPLTIRERIAIHCVILILNITKPNQYEYQVSTVINRILEEM